MNINKGNYIKPHIDAGKMIFEDFFPKDAYPYTNFPGVRF